MRSIFNTRGLSLIQMWTDALASVKPGFALPAFVLALNNPCNFLTAAQRCSFESEYRTQGVSEGRREAQHTMLMYTLFYSGYTDHSLTSQEESSQADNTRHYYGTILRQNVTNLSVFTSSYDARSAKHDSALTGTISDAAVWSGRLVWNPPRDSWLCEIVCAKNSTAGET